MGVETLMLLVMYNFLYKYLYNQVTFILVSELIDINQKNLVQ